MPLLRSVENFIEKSKIAFNQTLGQSFDFLTNEYEQNNRTFTPASPFGQIISVLNGLFSMSMYYLEDSIAEQNIYTATRDVSIRNWSRMSGHNPSRANSANGSIKVRLKSGSEGQIEGRYVIINKDTQLECINNGKLYTVVFERNQVRISKNVRDFSTLLIYQGNFEEQEFRHEGDILESFNVLGVDGQYMDDQFITIEVNGKPWETFESLYDMGSDTEGVLVKTGLNNGIDIFFGNGYFGKIPPRGSTIRVRYLNTDGFDGNLYGDPESLSFEWQDNGFDELGNSIDLNEVLDLRVDINPIFGSNPEDREFTKLIAPQASKSFVLANANNYIYFLRRLNIFSYVNAYSTFDDDYLDDDNVVYLFLIPDITRKLTSDSNYFTTPENNFFLDKIEKDKLLATINESGKQVVNTELQIVNPIIRRYILNIIIRVFEGYDVEDIKSQIIEKLGDYFLNRQRRDRIPISDITTIIDGDVEGVDSVKAYFKSQRNEEAITRGFYILQEKINGILTERRINLSDGDDPNLGLDELGDIKIGRDELPLIRGGWTDRDGQFYEETPDSNKFSSVNIMIKEIIKKDPFTNQ